MASSVTSMTGFARADGAYENWRWTWELKSVNGRGLEMRFRLPPGADQIEPLLRTALQKKIKRGSVFANLQVSASGSDAKVQINAAVLNEAIKAVENISEKIDCAPPRAEAILALRGVMEPADDAMDDAQRAKLDAAFIKSFGKAVDALLTARQQEGEAMAAVLADHISSVESLTKKAMDNAAASLSAIRERISAQLNELLEGNAVQEDRLAQEASIMAVKADIREEIDRLTAHVAAARTLLARGGAVGRELDFLTQEFNRETNTLCSKAQDITLKQTGLDLKKVIDQMREQVQNIE